MSRLIAGSALTTTALVLLLTGCSGGATPTSPPTTSAPATPTQTPTSTPTHSVDPNAPTGQCADDALQVSVENVDAGAGSIYFNVVFTNTGGGSCELRGAPGVSVVDASENELGVPAEQVDDDSPATVTLEPGASVSAPLQVTNIAPGGGPLDDCPVVEGTGYRVFPPHSFTGFIVSSSDPVPACSSSTVFMKVSPVAASS